MSPKKKKAPKLALCEATLYVKLPQALYDSLVELANSRGDTVSRVVRELVAAAVK